MKHQRTHLCDPLARNGRALILKFLWPHLKSSGPKPISAETFVPHTVPAHRESNNFQFIENHPPTSLQECQCQAMGSSPRPGSTTESLPKSVCICKESMYKNNLK